MNIRTIKLYLLKYALLVGLALLLYCNYFSCVILELLLAKKTPRILILNSLHLKFKFGLFLSYLWVVEENSQYILNSNHGSTADYAAFREHWDQAYITINLLF